MKTLAVPFEDFLVAQRAVYPDYGVDDEQLEEKYAALFNTQELTAMLQRMLPEGFEALVEQANLMVYDSELYRQVMAEEDYTTDPLLVGELGCLLTIGDSAILLLDVNLIHQEVKQNPGSACFTLLNFVFIWHMMERGDLSQSKPGIMTWKGTDYDSQAIHALIEDTPLPIEAEGMDKSALAVVAQTAVPWSQEANARTLHAMHLLQMIPSNPLTSLIVGKWIERMEQELDEACEYEATLNIPLLGFEEGTERTQVESWINEHRSAIN